MSAINLVRKAKLVNVRDAQAQLSKLIRSTSPTMILSHGKPVSFLVPYEDMLNLVDTLNELKDNRLLGKIKRARTEYSQGKAGPAERLFKKLRAAKGDLPRPRVARAQRPPLMAPPVPVLPRLPQ